MKILFASDHAGFELKQEIIPFVQGLGFEVEDKGAYSYDKDDDYPDYIALVAQAVSADPEGAKGIVLGGSGQGEAMVANRFPNVRAALYYGGASDIITLSREHNNANILSLSARFLSAQEAKEAVRVWLAAPFGNEERHTRRLQKIREIEGENFV